MAISAGGLRAQEFLLEPDVRVEYIPSLCVQSSWPECPGLPSWRTTEVVVARAEHCWLVGAGVVLVALDVFIDGLPDQVGQSAILSASDLFELCSLVRVESPG